MTDDLRTLLLGSLAAEERRRAAEPSQPTATGYRSEVGRRRALRRAVEATGALMVAGVIAVAVLVAGHSTRDLAPAPPAASVPADPAEREWSPPGTLHPDGVVMPWTEFWDVASEQVPGCAALDALGRLRGASELGGEPVTLGTVEGEDGGSNQVVARVFPSTSASSAFLDEYSAAAVACQDQVAALDAGVTVDVADVGVGAVEGTGVRVDIGADDGYGGRWTSWVHVSGEEALAVMVEPGVDNLGSQIIASWFAAGTG
ncbi:hypothetical protein [Demequina gelatinilytica]|uniref:hypothetical protein n=1 Tax=Demequina gelatinilytica TaxID=1638980 RepID=UPI00078422B0|nr:hypothetical protein [Demequina gelatinilytica]